MMDEKEEEYSRMRPHTKMYGKGEENIEYDAGLRLLFVARNRYR